MSVGCDKSLLRFLKRQTSKWHMSDKLSSSDFNSFQDFMEKIDNCEPGSMFALNPQCTAACLCHDGLSEVVQCPVGLAYDSHADKCLLPHLAKWYNPSLQILTNQQFCFS